MKTIAFFNNKGGVGKTTLVYHLAHMLTILGKKVLVADIDPQSNLTAMLLGHDKLETIWGKQNRQTIFGGVQPLIRGTSDINNDVGLPVDEFNDDSENNFYLLAGDLKLSDFEDTLSETWPKCLEGDERAFRIQTAFARLLKGIEKQSEYGIDYALVDIGPNLGAINRAALIACDYVITPLSPDLFSWQGMLNFGSRLKQWRKRWEERRDKLPDDLKNDTDFYLPTGQMQPLGYIVMRYNIRRDRPTQSFERWIKKMPQAFCSLLDPIPNPPPDADNDPHKIATIKDYFSLMPMAQEKQKPMFSLKNADGIVGSHQQAVQSCYQDFQALSANIIRRTEQNNTYS